MAFHFFCATLYRQLGAELMMLNQRAPTVFNWGRGLSSVVIFCLKIEGHITGGRQFTVFLDFHFPPIFHH